MGLKEKDFTKGGTKIEGAYENDRNAESTKLFTDIIEEACGVSNVIIAHHMVYVTSEKVDGFVDTNVTEVPSADTLIFDHDIASKIWGPNFKDVLCKLACEPVATRDKLLSDLYYARPKPLKRSV